LPISKRDFNPEAIKDWEVSMNNNRRRKQDGFTLIELLVVIIILGLLSALVAPKFFGKVDKAKLKTAKTQIELFGSALDEFRLDNNRYPTTAEGLESLRTKPGGLANWDGPYLPKQIPQDPWGRPYVYTSPGEHGPYDLLSYGPDGAAGGENNIVSWQ
jgi:general secretion pathway protein G